MVFFTLMSEASWRLTYHQYPSLYFDLDIDLVHVVSLAKIQMVINAKWPSETHNMTLRVSVVLEAGLSKWQSL